MQRQGLHTGSGCKHRVPLSRPLRLHHHPAAVHAVLQVAAKCLAKRPAIATFELVLAR